MSTASGFVRFATLSGAMTNDRGEFRLFGIAPGEYMLYATTQALQGEKRRYAPIYYPGVLDAASAQHLQVLPGQDIANVDFTFRLITTVTVSGIALLPDGQPMPGGALALYGAAGAGELTQVGSVRTDGSFSVVAIPGQYVLRARHSSFPGAASGAGRVNFSVAQPLTVGTEDISGLVLKVTQGATLSGRMTFEGTAAPESLWGFSLTVDSGGPGEVVTGKPDPTGAVVVRGIESGARRVRASVPKGWMLKSIYLDGRDVADVPIEFRDDTTVSSVNVVFTDSLTRLHVRVRYPQSENSSIVVVFPDDSSLASDRRVAVRAASKDLLTIEALPPGEYLVVALSDASMKGLQQPGDALQKRLRPLAQRVQILDAAAVTITLNAVPVPR